jgi:hypothetical protein
MKKKETKLSKWEKDWYNAKAEAKKWGCEDEFSLPFEPVLGRTGGWDKKKKDAVLGRIVEIGWADSPPMLGFCYLQKWDKEVYFFDLSSLKPLECPDFVNPDQIRKIYPLSEYKQYQKLLKRK